MLTSVCGSHHPVCAGQSLAKLLLMAVPSPCGQGCVAPLETLGILLSSSGVPIGLEPLCPRQGPVHWCFPEPVLASSLPHLLELLVVPFLESTCTHIPISSWESYPLRISMCSLVLPFSPCLRGNVGEPFSSTPSFIILIKILETSCL